MSVTVTYISAFTEKKTAEWGGHSHGFDSRYEYEVPSINEFNHLNKTCSEMQKCISENSSELRQVQKKQTDDLNKLSKEFVNIKNREQEFEESIKTFVEQQLSEGSPFFSFFSQVIQAHIENVQKRTDEIKTVSKEIFALREDIANKISLCKNDIRQNEEKHTIFFQELKAEGKQLTASRNTAEKEIKEWTKCIRQSVEQAQNDFEKIQQRQQELKQNTDVIAEQLHVSQKTSELLQAYEERIKKLEAIVVELKTNRKQTQSVLLAQEKAESVLQISVKAGVASNEPLQINKTIKSTAKERTNSVKSQPKTLDAMNSEPFQQEVEVKPSLQKQSPPKKVVSTVEASQSTISRKVVRLRAKEQLPQDEKEPTTQPKPSFWSRFFGRK